MTDETVIEAPEGHRSAGQESRSRRRSTRKRLGAATRDLREQAPGDRRPA